MSRNGLIAKNTIILYMRMIFILCVGLYTSRVVLNTLGVEDYGLYNVVGGFVAFFAFLNGAMTTATQRFVTFELARGELDRQKITFSMAIIIHFVIGIIVVILAETIGLWFLYEKLVIPESRFVAAFWVYQFSVASMFISIASIPYNALIIAHEKMSAFAFISILDTILKLIFVFCLIIEPWDKLIFYAASLFFVGLVDRVVYGIYCKRKFNESSFVLTFDKSLFRDMTNIAGWSMFGNIAGILYTQGLNMLLNMFFGPVVNAARGVAVTVQGVVSGFVSNFQMALNPQITKNYAVGDLQRMHLLIYVSSKFSYFLLLLIVLPIMIEAHTILVLWLKIVPDYTVWFLRLILSIMLVEAIANPMMISSQAVGKVKIYQSVVGGILLLILPLAYIVLKLGGQPESVFIVQLVMSIVAQGCRIYIVSRMIQLPINDYIQKVIFPIAGVSLVSGMLSVSCFYALPVTVFSAFIVIVLSIFITLGTIATLGLSKAEREFVMQKIRNILMVRKAK